MLNIKLVYTLVQGKKVTELSLQREYFKCVQFMLFSCILSEQATMNQLLPGMDYTHPHTPPLEIHSLFKWGTADNVKQFLWRYQSGQRRGLELMVRHQETAHPVLPPPGVRGQGRCPPCSHLLLQPDLLLSWPVSLIHIPCLSGDDAMAATSRPPSPTSARYSSGQRRTSHYQYLQLLRAAKVSISEQPTK